MHCEKKMITDRKKDSAQIIKYGIRQFLFIFIAGDIILWPKQFFINLINVMLIKIRKKFIGKLFMKTMLCLSSVYLKNKDSAKNEIMFQTGI